jgi:hypothetical protein
VSDAFSDILNEDDTEEVVETTEAPEVDVVEDIAAADTPSEPVAGSATDDAAPPVPSDLPEGYTRDAQGRVHRPNGTIASKEEVAAFPVPEPVAPPVVTPEPVAPPEPEPYTVRFAGQKQPIPHTYRNADGSLVVKPEGVAVIQDLVTQGLANKHSWPREKAAYEARIKQAEAMAEAKPRKYNDAAVLMYDHITNPEWLARAAQNPEIVDLLRQRIEITLQRADLAIPKAPEVESAAPDPQQLQQAAASVLSEELEDLLDQPSAKTLFGADERKELSETMLSLMPAFFTEHEGEIVLDRHALKRAFEREVSKQQRIQSAALKATQDAQKAREAAAFNAAQKPSVPAVRPKPVVAATVPSTRPASWDQRVNDIWKEADED